MCLVGLGWVEGGRKAERERSGGREGVNKGERGRDRVSERVRDRVLRGKVGRVWAMFQGINLLEEGS